METPGQPTKICFLRWIRWMDTINGINLHDNGRLGRIFTRIFYIIQLVQLLVGYNFVMSCFYSNSLQVFAIHFNTFGGLLLTFLRLFTISYYRTDLVKTAQFINASVFHHLYERAEEIRIRTVRAAGMFFSTLMGIQGVTLIFWFALNEWQAREQDVLLPVLTYLPFDVSYWPTTVKSIFRIGFYTAYTQLMFTFFGSYVITSSYLLTLTIELRILNESYAGAPDSNPQELVNFLKDRVVYKVELLKHIGIVKRHMNVSILLEVVFIVCLLSINGLRLCTTNSDLSEVALSSSMILIYMLELFQYCWQVDEMEILHERQAFAIYSTPWVDASRSTKALLLITTKMAHVPLRFMCGGMYQLSTALFATIVQFIYSLIMMLLQFK